MGASMTTTHVPPEWRTLGQRVGYGTTILVDLLLLWIVDNLLVWDVLPFLTDEFGQVSRLIMFSLVASMVAHASLLVSERPRSGSVEQAVLAGINLWVAIQVLRVFPFDFARYGFDWAIVVRVLLALAVVGAVVDLVASLSRLARLADR